MLVGLSAGCAHAEVLLRRLDCNLHILDLPGWGRSPLPRAVLDAADHLTIVNLSVDMLYGWLGAVGLRGAHVVIIGHSYGAMLATTFSSKYPTCVEQLILRPGLLLFKYLVRNRDWGVRVLDFL